MLFGKPCISKHQYRKLINLYYFQYWQPTEPSKTLCLIEQLFSLALFMHEILSAKVIFIVQGLILFSNK